MQMLTYLIYLFFNLNSTNVAQIDPLWPNAYLNVDIVHTVRASTFSRTVPNHATPVRLKRVRFAKNRFAKSTVRYGTVREKVDARTVYFIRLLFFKPFLRMPRVFQVLERH